MKNTITSKEACSIAHKIRRETGCSLAEAFKAAYAGNININPKTSWTKEELDQIFSEKVAELLKKGYIIYTDKMAGSQGEIAKVIFRKDGEIYALFMDSYHVDYDNRYGEEIRINFGKFPGESWSIVWLNQVEISWSLSVIKMSDNYFVTPELAEEANRVSRDRYKQRMTFNKVAMNNKYHNVVLPIVRKHKGFKTLKECQILDVYRISGRGRRYYQVVTEKGTIGIEFTINN